jgi:hypothetical protein
MRNYAVIIDRCRTATTAAGFRISPDASPPEIHAKRWSATSAKPFEFHLEGMREDGDPIPGPGTDIFFAEVAE